MNPIARKFAIALLVAAPVAGAVGYKANTDGRIASRTEPYSLLCDSDAVRFGKDRVYIVKENSFTDNLIKTFQNRIADHFSWRPADAQRYAADSAYRVRRNQIMLDSQAGVRELMKKELRMDFAQSCRTALQDTVKVIKNIR